MGGRGVPREGQHLNEYTISSLLEFGRNLWNASQGRGLEWVSNRKFWAVYAYITFLSHPERVVNKHKFPLFEYEGGAAGGERPGHGLHTVQKQMWLLKIQTSFSPRKRA